jgi:glutamate--cysteine ligase
MFFIVRDARYSAMNGKTFRRFWQDGHDGEHATLADWDRHLTTLFPEVRVKRVLEVRCADAVPVPLLGSVPALWKGILYDAEARAAAAELAARTPQQRDSIHLDVARRGLGADTPIGPMREVARALAGIAREGLVRQGRADAAAADLLDPLDEILERGKSPGEIVLECWQGEWAGDPGRLIDATRY